jgi:hypothetical protein
MRINLRGRKKVLRMRVNFRGRKKVLILRRSRS